MGFLFTLPLGVTETVIKCPSCGFANPESREKCLKCKALLRSQDVADGSKIADRPSMPNNPLYGFRRAVYTWSKKFERPLPTGLSHRWYWMAGYLGLFLGAGQFYNHQYIKGIIFALIQIAWFVAFVWTIFDPISDVVVLGMLFWHLFAMADAFSIAVKINGDRWTWRQLTALWFGLIFTVGALLFLLQFFGSGFFLLTSVRSSALRPAFEKGDKLFVWSWPFRESMITRGSVVYYDPTGITYIRVGGMSTDTFVANEQSSFGVVTGLPGDVISWEDLGQIKLNGAPVPPNLLPVNPNGTPGKNDGFTVPQDTYGVLFTHEVSEFGLLSGLGGSFGGGVPDPRSALRSGYGIQNYIEASTPPKDEMFGIVLFRYYPPERRQWFGYSGGLWQDYPTWYPENQEVDD